MPLAGYLLFGVFLLGPLLGAVIASVRGRARMLFLSPLWFATVGTVLYGMKLTSARLNLPESAQAAELLMAFGVAAWVFLVPALVFRKPPEQAPDEDRDDKDDEQEEA